MTEAVRWCARITFAKRGPLRFVGHLDMARALDRAVRRARLPVAYSEGFNPRARIAFGPPLPLGTEGVAEPCVMDLTGPMDATELRERLAAQMPDGLELVTAEVVPRGRRSPLADLTRAVYEVDLDLSPEQWQRLREVAQGVLAADRVEACRVRGTDARTRDIRPGIHALEFSPATAGRLTMTLGLEPGATATPAEVLEVLGRGLGAWEGLRVVRLVRKCLH